MRAYSHWRGTTGPARGESARAEKGTGPLPRRISRAAAARGGPLATAEPPAGELGEPDPQVPGAGPAEAEAPEVGE